MDFTSSQKETVRHQFDAFCKKVLSAERIDCQRKLNSQKNKEILFSEMRRGDFDDLQTADRYPSDMTLFKVEDFEIGIEDDLLAGALSTLSHTSRDIVLLSYFLDLSDTEIAKTLNIVRRTVQYRRTSSLNKIKKIMEKTQ